MTSNLIKIFRNCKFSGEKAKIMNQISPASFDFNESELKNQYLKN